MNRPDRVRAWCFFAILSVISVSAVAAQAQVQALGQTPADAWLKHTLGEQRGWDVYRRYVAAPSAVLFGGFALLLPAAGDFGPAASSAFIASGALMLTAAVGTWTHSDPYIAHRRFAVPAALGFVALGAGLALSCAVRDNGCGNKSFTRNVQLGLGIAEAGYFAASLLAMMLVPAPSPTELELSVRDVSPAEREARVLAFLEQRDKARRIETYVSAPWALAMGGVFMASAPDAATDGAKVLMYAHGGVLIGLTLAGVLYQLLRKPDASRLRAGETP